jgi:hypothetical protein
VGVLRDVDALRGELRLRPRGQVGRRRSRLHPRQLLELGYLSVESLQDRRRVADDGVDIGEVAEHLLGRCIEDRSEVGIEVHRVEVGGVGGLFVRYVGHGPNAGRSAGVCARYLSVDNIF